MQGNRHRDTGPEIKVRRQLHAAGLRYRVDWPLPFDRRRRADIAFTKAKVAVFIDGCFWHRCPVHYIAPKANATYWDDKTARNAARDAESTACLLAIGWTVLRFWEHEPVPEVVAAILSELGREQSPIGTLHMSPESCGRTPLAGSLDAESLL